MLTLRHLTIKYGETVAVDDVSLDLPDSRVLAVLGPSGCGKSTLLRAIAGLEPVSAGVVALDGRSLAGVPTHKRGFALMFQDGQLFDHMSVGRNVAYALRLRRTSSASVRDRVDGLLELVGLAGYADRMPRSLSGGERQRVALARALAVDPRLMLLDEPLSALDATLRQRLAGDLRKILADAGTTAMVVTHDHEEAFALADDLAVMRAGRVVQSGPIAEVWAAPVDAETAQFLGYANVLTGTAAARVARVAGLGRVPSQLAVRRSALVADPDGELTATVVAARATPEQVRLVVEVSGVGVLDAVAPRNQSPGPGQRITLRVDAARVAAVGGTAGGSGGSGGMAGGDGPSPAGPAAT